MPPKDTGKSKSVKIERATYERLQDLVGEIARFGWESYGVNRSDWPSLGVVLDEAVTALAARRKRK